MTDWPVSFKVLPDFEPLVPDEDEEEDGDE